LKNITALLTEIESLKAAMGKEGSLPTPNMKEIISEVKINTLKSKMEELEEEIERQLDDLYAYLEMKKSSIESLNDMRDYVVSEIQKVEQDLKKLNFGK
jgi:polyhydroxyalkanoate synthesis regulator phasin